MGGTQIDDAGARQPFPEAESIAIVGMGCRFPGAKDLKAFWNLLCAGVDAVTEFPNDRWDNDAIFNPDPSVPGKTNIRQGGFLERLQQFDANFFGISPSEAAHLDPRQRLMLELAWEALEDAGIPVDALSGSQTGVFAASLHNDYSDMLAHDLKRVDAYFGTNSSSSLISNRLSYVFNFHGPSITVDTACSGSLVAIHLACQSLRAGESTLALVGGVNLFFNPASNIFYSKAGLVAPDQRCKSFDARANGIIRSEGAGVVVLKPMAQALADGDSVYAVIRGTAVNSDGRTKTVTSPSVEAQIAVMHEAYRHSGIVGAQVQYIEAHGTGTRVGDAKEIQALSAVLGPGRPLDTKCALGSLKTNLGHMECAAGIGSLIKTALAMKHRLLPPIVHFKTPNSALLPLDKSPLAVQRTLGPWPVPDQPLIAGVHGLAIGGTNAHIVLQEVPIVSASFTKSIQSDRIAQIIPLSARNPQALLALATTYVEHLLADTSSSLEEIAFTASVRRSHHDTRLAVVANSRAELVDHLSAFGKGEAHARVISASSHANQQSRMLFVFSGQGSHWLGMGCKLLQQEPVFRKVLAECDQIIQRLANWSLIAELEREHDVSEMYDAQIAVIAMQIGLAALWQSWGIIPDGIVGQSVGEVAAAHVAGVLNLEDALRIVISRSQLMKAVAGSGKTVVVELALEQAKLLLSTYDRVSIAGSLSPTSSVLSGDPAVLDQVLVELRRREISYRVVNGVDVAVHSPYMDVLRPQLVAMLTQLEPFPEKIPIYSCVAGKQIMGTSFTKEYWGANLREPFSFSQVMQQVITDGYSTVMEVSPHPVLLSAIRDCFSHAKKEAIILPSLRRKEDPRSRLLTSLATLYSQGMPVSWSHVASKTRPIALPTYPWQRHCYWFEQQSDKTAPPLQQRASGEHPLLGEHIEVAFPHDSHIWEMDMSTTTLSYLEEHVVQSAPMMPGSAYLEMGLVATQQAFPGFTYVAESVVFQRPMYLSRSDARRLQLSLTVEAPDLATFKIFSRPANSPQTEWTLHATGKVRYTTEIATEPPMDDTIHDIRQRCIEELPPLEHYQKMANRGYEYGANFEAIEKMWRRDGEALALLTLPEQLMPGSEAYQIHPVLLDNSFQVASAAESTEDVAKVIPIGIDGFQMYRRVTGPLWCHVVKDKGLPGQTGYAITLRAMDGGVVAVASSLRLHLLGVKHNAVQNMKDWFYSLSWQPKERVSLPPVVASRGGWVIFSDSMGIGHRLAKQLEEHGERCVHVVSGTVYASLEAQHIYMIDPLQPQDYVDLIHDISANGPPCRGIIHLWGSSITTPEAATAETFVRAQEQGSLSVFYLVQAIARFTWQLQPRLWLVTRGAQPVNNNFSGLGLAHAPIWGMGRIVALEHRGLLGGMIDLEPSSSTDIASNNIFQEIWQSDGEDHIAFRSEQRFVARLTRSPELFARGHMSHFRPNGSYLITGGLGGLGLAVARWMVEKGARRLILLGRSSLPPRSTWANVPQSSSSAQKIAAICELEALGASVQYSTVDVSNEAQLSAFLHNYRQENWPPIRGVIHSAGILNDKIMLRMVRSEFEEVQKPKIVGAWLLHKLLGDMPIDFFILFSSAASMIGSFGQVNYASGNAFMDALAHYRSAIGLPALSINWGPWSDIGMAASLNFADRGMQKLTPNQGINVLDNLLGTTVTQVGVMPIDWANFDFGPSTTDRPSLFAAIGQDLGTVGGPEPKLTQEWLELHTDSSAREAALTDMIQRLVADAMASSKQQIALDQPLFAIGIDSLIAVGLEGKIKRATGVKLSVLDMLQDMTVAQVVARLLPQLPASPH